MILSEIAAKLTFRPHRDQTINPDSMVQKAIPSPESKPLQAGPLVLRSALETDVTALRALCAEPTPWDIEAFDPIDTCEVVEIDDRVVAVARSGVARFQPDWAPQPWPAIPPRWLDGTPDTVVGAGLWIDESLDLDTAVRIHRLVRTMRAQQEAARWCLVCVPYPVPDPHTRVSAAQHAAFGAFGDGPLPRLVDDGYWPIALHPTKAAVWCVWRNDAM